MTSKFELAWVNRMREEAERSPLTVGGLTEDDTPLVADFELMWEGKSPLSRKGKLYYYEFSDVLGPPYREVHTIIRGLYSELKDPCTRRLLSMTSEYYRMIGPSDVETCLPYVKAFYAYKRKIRLVNIALVADFAVAYDWLRRNNIKKDRAKQIICGMILSGVRRLEGDRK